MSTTDVSGAEIDTSRMQVSDEVAIDMIGVISFDETFNWVIPMGPAGSLEDKSNLISQITANGGTKIYQAVEAGFEAIVERPAVIAEGHRYLDGARAHDHGAVGMAAFTLGRLQFLRGRYRDAARWVAEARVHAGHRDPFNSMVVIESLAVGVAASTGDFDGAGAALER